MGKDAEVPRAAQKMQDGRSLGNASGWDSLPESPSQNWNRHDEKRGLFVLPNLVWRGKGQELFGPLSVHFLSIFPGEEQLKHTPDSFQKPLLRLAALMLL